MALPDGYSTIVGSDAQRDGMFLELYHGTRLVAEAFFSDATKRINVSQFEDSLPIELVEFLCAEAWRRLPPLAPPEPLLEPDYLLDLQTDSGGSQVFLHADLGGLTKLIDSLTWLKGKVESGACEHDHLRAPDWAGDELSSSVLEEGTRHISHIKLYGWTDEWLAEHPRDTKDAGQQDGAE